MMRDYARMSHINSLSYVLGNDGTKQVMMLRILAEDPGHRSLKITEDRKTTSADIQLSIA